MHSIEDAQQMLWPIHAAYSMVMGVIEQYDVSVYEVGCLRKSLTTSHIAVTGCPLYRATCRPSLRYATMHAACKQQFDMYNAHTHTRSSYPCCRRLSDTLYYNVCFPIRDGRGTRR